jgi:hypothetical protein
MLLLFSFDLIYFLHYLLSIHTQRTFSLNTHPYFYFILSSFFSRFWLFTHTRHTHISTFCLWFILSSPFYDSLTHKHNSESVIYSLSTPTNNHHICILFYSSIFFVPYFSKTHTYRHMFMFCYLYSLLFCISSCVLCSYSYLYFILRHYIYSYWFVFRIYDLILHTLVKNKNNVHEKCKVIIITVCMYVRACVRMKNNHDKIKHTHFFPLTFLFLLLFLHTRTHNSQSLHIYSPTTTTALNNHIYIWSYHPSSLVFIYVLLFAFSSCFKIFILQSKLYHKVVIYWKS